MRKVLLSILISLAASTSSASPATDALLRCFSDSTTGKDRTELARWFFTGMAAHPAIKDLSAVTPEAQESISRSIGAIYTRLIGENCPKETSAVIRADGEPALSAGYEFLGRLAMQELMANPVVGQVFVNAGKYVDSSKVRAALQAN